VNYREMDLSDYDNVISLWQEVEGVCLREADSKEGIAKYLLRNPKLSFIADIDGEIVGTIMSGHEGKRGYIQHLAVAEKCRNKGVASDLLDLCVTALKDEGIIKSHIHVLASNLSAKKYWEKCGWNKRNDIEVYSYINGGGENT
jgi:ribosomal protein S18 acetylase RimI-like enzyme